MLFFEFIHFLWIMFCVTLIYDEFMQTSFIWSLSSKLVSKCNTIDFETSSKINGNTDNTYACAMRHSDKTSIYISNIRNRLYY